MCKETDENDAPPTTKRTKRSKEADDDTGLKELPTELPEPKQPPPPPDQVFPLPQHSAGTFGDPLQIASMEQLQDLELSEMSGP